LGTTADLARLVTEYRAEAVALAIPDLPPARIHELTDAAIGAGAVVRYLPWHTAASSREAAGADLRPLDIRALIDGPRPHVVWPEVKEIITGKRILVTGADGPLGSEICRQLQAFNPDALFLLDIDQDQDQDQADQTFRELTPEVVFHAGSLRHPSVLERRPSHGVKANILSTDNLVRAATRYGSERFVLISTDADPASMLGASHRVAEAIVRAAAYKAKSGKPGPQAVFAAVRIGDVLDTRDSLLTLLADQIRAGGPVTITHPDATRCFATVEEAVALALDAGHTATGGEVYTLDLGEPTRVIDVVSRFTRQYKLPEVPIRYVGVRLPQRKDPRPTERIPTPQPQIFTTPTDADATDYARLPERLDKLYKAAAKNRDPKVRQMLLKLAEASSDKTG
jgi:FlaA1/EpsC-like NDP-sugar epimerase